MRHHRIYDWLRRRPYVVDAGIVVILSGLLLIGSGFFSGEIPGLLSAFLLLPLVWRRRYPVAVFTVVSFGCLAQLILLDVPINGDIAFPFALYAVSAYARRIWVRLAALGVGALGAVLGPLDWVQPEQAGNWSSILLVHAALVALSWTLGDLMRTRRAYVGELEERARRLEFERDQQALLARAAERARIARELHDVVAHSLSVVVAQADGGLYAGEKDAGAAREALKTIGATSRQALSEMRRLLGVLRSGNEADDAEFTPQPCLAQLPDLVAQVRSSGMAVDLAVDGEPRALAGGTELTAYRIVQEALTNTLKHGGPTARASVRLSYADDALRVRVCDDGRGAAASSDGQGQGLAGMRERIAVYGGQLRAGPRRGGGFEVLAELPLTGAERGRVAGRLVGDGV